MKIVYGQEVDALSIIFYDTTVTTKDISESIVAEYDKDGHLAGLEILDVSKMLGSDETLNEVVIKSFGLARSGK